MTLRITPITLEEANAFVETHHRHHDPVIGHKFSIAVSDETDTVRGVAIVGRPVARRLDNGYRVEVNRVATDGARNACSMLLGACRRVAKELGYKEILTYTLESEGGASLRAAGWQCLGKATTKPGQGWNQPSRPRVDTHPLQQKLKWGVDL